VWCFNPCHTLLLLFFLANVLLLLRFLPKNTARVEILFDPGQGTSKVHGHETSFMMGRTGLVSSSQPAQVSSGKPNLYLLSLPAIKATVPLNTEGNLEFVAKYRQGSPLHPFALAVSALQSRVQLQQHSARRHYLLAASLALLHIFGPENISQTYHMSTSQRPINSQVRDFQKNP